MLGECVCVRPDPPLPAAARRARRQRGSVPLKTPSHTKSCTPGTLDHDL